MIDFCNVFYFKVSLMLAAFYFGIFLKVYCLPNTLSFKAIAPISFLPGYIVYAHKLVSQFGRSS